ncbi:MAG: LTA synthase family protein [Peptococcaceae bacterium]|nr:LTA synthase family protein [Peptococcaceae bacterium]
MKKQSKGLGVVPSLALLVLAALVLTAGVIWLQPGDVALVAAAMQARPVALVLNVVPVFLLLVAAYFLLGNVCWATALIGALVLGLSLANRLKIQIREDPLSFQDIFLYREAMEAAKSYHIDWPWALVAAVAACVLVAIVLGFFIKSRMPRRKLARIALVILPMALLALMVQTVIADRHIYDHIPVSNEGNMATMYCERGYVYSFLHYITTYSVAEPEGFDKAEAASWNDAATSDADAAAVNVVLVQNEAFSDITSWDGFAFADGDDPLANFHSLQNDAHAISGHIVVPQFAGGTANTEFDVLTGMQTINTASSAFRALHHNTGSLYRVFDDEDYETSMFHPGEAWFYNRENVYRWFGSEDIRFKEDMPGLAEEGGWTMDTSFADVIIDNLNTQTAAGKHVFNESVTIQNHMSYTNDKYGDVAIPEVPLSVEMSQADHDMLSVYTKGVRDADAMLKKLTDAYRDSETPVVFAFYGDHLPYLGDDQRIYKLLGKNFSGDNPTDAASLQAYETPFIIWANDAAADALGWDAAVQKLSLPENPTISACYLGATVLELTGRKDADPWFSFLADLRKTYPVLTTDVVMTADGSLRATSDLSEAEAAPINKMKQWSYYRLKYDKPQD